jgi:hypothetical protein
MAQVTNTSGTTNQVSVVPSSTVSYEPVRPEPGSYSVPAEQPKEKS